MARSIVRFPFSVPLNRYSRCSSLAASTNELALVGGRVVRPESLLPVTEIPKLRPRRGWEDRPAIREIFLLRAPVLASLAETPRKACLATEERDLATRTEAWAEEVMELVRAIESALGGSEAA